MSIKPIEIEFVAKDRITPTLGQMEQAAEEFGVSAAQASDKAARHIKSLEADIKALKAELRKMQEQSNASSSEGIEELRAELQACRKIVEEQAEALNRLKTRHNETTSSAKNLVQEQRQLTQSLAQLKVEGKESTDEYARMRQRLAEITDAMGDVRQEAQALAHDDQHLNALSTGLTGLAGAATATTGVLSLFVSEQEELIKIQTKLQSVMAITMGIQQAMDALNQSSAFRIVLLAKAKILLATANTRLAVALGISTAAAQALMATLTLGLSTAIAGAIYLYNKYADAQAEAKAKRDELLQVEVQGRAESIKTRYEMEQTLRKVKEFNGTKAEERRMVEELNRTKGETFGYYSTLADWYDALKAKGEAYIDTLYRETKVRSLLSKAAEAAEEVVKLSSKPVEEYHTYGWIPKVIRPKSLDIMGYTRGAISHAEELAAAIQKRDSYLAQAKALDEEAEAKRKEAGLGDHIDPEEAKRKELEARRKVEVERAKTLDLIKSYAAAELSAQREIEDARARAIGAQYEREREQLRLQYGRRLEEITVWETQQLELIAKLRARGYKVASGAEGKSKLTASALRVEAGAAYDKSVADSHTTEAKERAEELATLLSQHEDYDAKRRKIEADYAEYVAKLSKLRSEDNASAIEAALTQARKDADAARREVDEAEVSASERTATLLVRLYEDAGDKSISQIRRVIAETEALIEYLKTTPKEALEAQQGLSAKHLGLIQSDPAKLKALQDALKQYRDTLKTKSPLEDISSEWTKGLGAIKQGDRESIGKGIQHIGSAATKALQPLKALGSALSEIFGASELGDSISGVVDGLSAVAGVASGVGRIMAGDVLGGAQAVISGIASVVSMASQAEARHQEAMRQVEAARLAYQREYTTLLLRQSLLLKEASSAFGTQEILKAANALKVYDEAQRSLRDSLRGLSSTQIVNGHRKTGLFGWGKGADTYTSILSLYPKLINAQGELDTAQIKVILSTRKMTEETRAYLQGLVSQSDLLEQAKEQFDGYLESTFGSLGSSMTSALVASIREGRNALEVFAGDAAKVIEHMSEQMIYSMHFADRFRELQAQLRAAYKAGGGEQDVASRVRGVISGFVGGIAGTIKDAERDMRTLKQEASKQGLDLWGGAQAAQQGRSSAFVAMSQEQGTKLEGLFVSHAERLATLDEHVEAIMPRLSSILEAIQQVARNTEPISTILDEIRRIKQDGLKVQ